jgi:hypothetical protein
MISKCEHVTSFQTPSWLCLSVNLPQSLLTLPSVHCARSGTTSHAQVVCVAVLLAPVSVSTSPSGCFFRWHMLDLALRGRLQWSAYLCRRWIRFPFDKAPECQCQKLQRCHKEAQNGSDPTKPAPQTHVLTLVADQPTQL